MFEGLYQWLQNISFYLILVNAVTYILPANSYRKYIRFFTGLVLIMMILTPMLNLFGIRSADVEYLMEKFRTQYEWNIPDSLEEEMETEENETVQIEVEDIIIGL